MLLHFLILLSSLWLSPVSSNTEIVNFEVKPALDHDLSFVEEWPMFSPRNNEKRFDVVPAPLGTPLRHVCAGPEDLLSKTPQCPHEIWFKLGLDQDGWDKFSKFTLRISWPASSPADFVIDVYDPQQVAARFQIPPVPASSSTTSDSGNTRLKYARIRLVDTGVRAPIVSVNPVPFPSTTATAEVPFIVIVEPLYFGAIPESVLPAGVIFAPLLASLVFVMPKVNAYIDGMASATRKELKDKNK
ncbi:hypothetical protein K435DRAFT_648719 [Dendrothele bispora CBS 962.96]|uniref:Uncharacterized protein n=1 Tax=Dendrothele bispora (strain CBS 962.96) TaxID=1314807 RepID=A0A4S8MP52_DENBC|nr:hypothetical protein K435DRAFT_648719 [Dendrothele bispora CBS 962.96]